MPSYNLTQLQAADNLGKVFIYANDVTGMILMGLILIAIFFILFMRTKQYGFTEAIASSSFACFILSLIFLYGNLLNFIYVLIFLILLALSVFWLYIER